MRDLLSIGTSRGCEMIGVGVGLGLSGYRLNPPGVLPVLDLQFSSLKTLTAATGPTPSFSRASSGDFFDSSGVLQTASTNNARFNHSYNGASWFSKGLLIEGQRTNLSQYSEDFTNAWWNKNNSTITSNATTAPDGTTTADKIVETSATDNHGVYTYPEGLGNLSTTVPYAISIFAKAGERKWLFCNPSDSMNRYTFFDLENGVVGTVASGVTASIQNVGNGWYRCVLTKTFSTANGNVFWGTATADNTHTFAGDTSKELYLWGFQFEKNTTFPTSYIPSLSNSSTIRSASVALVSGSDFTNIWNASEGTLIVEGDCAASGTRPLISLDDNTANERIEIYGSGTDPKVLVVDGGSTQVDIDAGTISSGTAFKLAFAYKANDFAVSLNGGTVATDTAGTLPAVDRLRIGANQAGDYLNGHISRLRYYPTRLSNATLQSLST